MLDLDIGEESLKELVLLGLNCGDSEDCPAAAADHLVEAGLEKFQLEEEHRPQYEKEGG